AEAQLASLADDIAYNNHDIDDGLRSGLFSLEAICAIPLVGNIFKNVKDRYPGIEQYRLIHETIRRMINIMVADVIGETNSRIAKHSPKSCDDIRMLDVEVVAFSEQMQVQIDLLKKFLMQNMYRHYKVNRMTSKARRIVANLFEFFLNEPECLSPEWKKLTDKPGSTQTARAVADFIAGMTDRFAIDEHERIFNMREKC
ncbi:MAG: deoxyguanosinetriphosphate triphosphohydrolase, partial [Pseudomonadota bacterium]